MSMNLQAVLDVLKHDAVGNEDGIYDANCLRVDDETGYLRHEHGKQWRLSSWAESQFCTKLGIPASYYARLPHHIQATCANHELRQREKVKDKSFLIRAKNELARAVLSESYVKFDNLEFLEIVEGLIGKAEGMIVKNWYKGDQSFSMKFVSEEIVGPDGLKAGIMLRNSEVGTASSQVLPFVFRKSCTNDLVVDDGRALRMSHIYHTKNELNERIATGIGDAFRVASETIDRFIETRREPVTNPIDIIKKLAEQRKMSDTFAKQVVEAFYAEPENTKYGVINSFTRAAQKLEGDNRIEIERFAGSMLHLALN